MNIPWLDAVVRDAQAPVRRFPLPLAFALLACVANDLLILMQGDHPRLAAVLVVATLGIALSLAVALFNERLPDVSPLARRLLMAIVPAALVIVALQWPGWTDEVQWRRYAQLSLLGHALVAVLPNARIREPNGFWHYNRLLLERFIVATVFASVLLAGLSGALASLKPLFGITVSFKAYALLSTWAYFVFHPWFFLAGIPADLSVLESRREYPATLRVFAQFILVPLVAVYQVLLTAYLVKVIATGRWPSGLIGWLVSVEATAGILALLLVHPVRDQAGNLWTRTFARGFHLALLPSIVMLAMSIAKRVGQYGITEDRYFVIVLTAWLAGISVTFIVRRDADIRLIPCTLALLAVATLGGPWGAYRISLQSQRTHLLRVLEAHGLWRDGRFQASRGTVPFEASKEISSTVAYLIGAHGSDALRPLFGAEVEAADRVFDDPRGRAPGERAEKLMSRLGIPYVNPWEGAQALNGDFSYAPDYRDTVEAASIEDFQYHVRVDPTARDFSAAGRHLKFDADEPGRRMVLLEGSGGQSSGRTQRPDTLGVMPLDSVIAATRRGRPAPDSRALRLELSGTGARGFARVISLSGNDGQTLAVHAWTCDLYFTLLAERRDSTAEANTPTGLQGR